MAKKDNPSRNKRKQLIIENVTSLGLALLLVFMIRSSIIEAFKIPSGSMIPTLLVGDHIFVNKFAYGLKFPFSDLVMDNPLYLIKRNPPERGDIIVFKYPKDESIYYIKRVVGRPGDTIELREKQLFINGTPMERVSADSVETQKVFKSLEGSQYDRENLQLFHETLGEHKPIIMTDRSHFIGDNFGPITVPQDHYFVMGDNRNYSNDSRFWGFVPIRNIKGRAIVIWLSLWIKLTDGPEFTFRPFRMGTVLE